MNRTPLSYLLSLTLTLTTVASAAPEDGPLQAQLAKAEAAGDRDARREIMLQLLQGRPADPELLRPLADLQLASRELDRCTETLARLAAALGKPDAWLLERRGDLTRARATDAAGRAAAAEHWRAALALEQDRVPALEKLANHHRARGEHAEEKIYLERLASLRDDPSDRAALAQHAVRDRDWKTLISHTAHLRERFADRDEAKYWNPMYDRLMARAAELAALDARLEASPGSAETLLERAWLFDAIRLDRLAAEDAAQALKLQPGSLAFRYQRAVILAHGGEADRARREYGIDADGYRSDRRMPREGFFEELLALEGRIASGGGATAYAARAALLLEDGQQDLARADAEAALDMDPGLAAAHLVLAQIHLRADHTRAAKDALHQVLEAEPDNLTALAELGHLQMTLGDFADAAATFGRHLDIRSSDDIADARRRCLTSLQETAR